MFNKLNVSNLGVPNTINLYLVNLPWYPVYEGDEGGTGSDQSKGGTGSDQSKGGTGSDQNKGGSDVNKTFTQEEVNNFLAEDRRKNKEQTQKLITDLENLKKSKNLSDQEKQQLNARLEELQTQVMTKEQLIEKERNRLQHEHQTEIQREKAEKDTWRNRYTEATIERTIVDEAVKADAFSNEQVVSYLQPITRLVEDVDDEGNPLGTYTPRVKFKDVDSNGKPTILDLTVPEAIKRMKDLPERFGNFFKSNFTGGLGGNGGVDKSGNFDPKKIKSYQDYMKQRDKILGIRK